MKKYRLRKFGPLWWVTRIGAAAFGVFSYYVIACAAFAFGG